MALNLKRKRNGESKPRKVVKLDETASIGSASEHDSGEESMDEEPGSGSEGEEWGGIGGAVEPESKRPVNPSPSKTTKAPTGEEIDALLPNIRPKLSRAPPLEKFLLQLHAFLINLPTVEPQHPLEAARKLLKKGIAVPYCLPLPTEDTNWKVSFEKPDDIALVGSWPNKVSVKPKDSHRYGVDIAVQMPDSLFQEKDYLNARFFQKKAYYLANLANSIRNSKSGLNVDVSYESTSGDPRLTKLVLTPKPDGSQTDFTKLNARVCIIPTVYSSCPISLHRLSPSHANIRVGSSTASEESTHSPTPVYNNALLTAFSPKPHLVSTYTLIQSIPSFSDALALLRLWVNQRGFGEGSKLCVKGFENAGPLWVSLLELVIHGEEPLASGIAKRKPLGKGLSSYQLFKTVLGCLAKTDFTTHPTLVKSAASHKFPIDEYKRNHSATFVDSSSLVNLLSYIPLGCLDLIRHEAAKTIQVLHSASLAVDPFTEVFLHDHRDVATRFDIIFQVDLSTAKARQPSLHSSLDFGSPANHLLFNMNSILRKALGNRARAVAFLQHSSTTAVPSNRPLDQAHPSTSSTIFVGLVLDPAHAFQLVQHGPAADSEDTEALSEFRELWGSKSEMRRFKDGRIMESVVWDVKTADERSHVPAMLVRHILQWHFGLSEEHVQTWQSDYDSTIRLPKEIATKYVQAGGSGMGFKGAMQAFDALVKALKALDGQLPLSLTNVGPISPSLRYTSTFSPVPLTPTLAASLPANARYSQPISIVFEFEQSAKWPDELRAIQKIKLAFFESVASGLMKSVHGLKASVVLGEGNVTDANELMDKAYLEIITHEGWAFHARIWHNREATLLDRILDDKGPLAHIVVSKKRKQGERKGKEYLDALEAKEVYDRRFVHAPRHHRAIVALSHQHSAFSGTCRLVKRWFASHWFLGGHASEEVVELLCAQMFVVDGKFVGSDVDTPSDNLSVIPSTKERGFAMVIRFLSEWKWEDGDLWVCLYGPRRKEGEDEAASAAGKQDVSRASSGGVWTVATDMDQGGKMWTKKGPDAIVARRIRALAGATWNYLQTIEDGTFNVQGMFIHPTKDYDFVVQLNPSVLPRYVHNIAAGEAFANKGKFVNANANAKTSEQDLVLPGFDPARSLFDDLQRTYSDTFRLFFDPYGGDMYGAVWDPTLKESRPFRVLGGFSSVPVKKENEKAKDKGLVALNDAGVLGEIQRLGSGLVKSIVKQN